VKKGNYPAMKKENKVRRKTRIRRKKKTWKKGLRKNYCAEIWKYFQDTEEPPLRGGSVGMREK